MIDFSWLIGGPQGSGVETASVIFSRVCALSGYQVFGKREFHSNIKGEHSYFEIRVSDGMVRSNTGLLDMFVSYDAETTFRHYDTVKPGGILIYDSDMGDVEVSDIATIDASRRKRVYEQARIGGVPPTIQGMLDMAKGAGVLLCPVSFKEILQDLAERHENPRLRQMKRIYNVLGVSLSMGMAGISKERLLEAVRSIFSAKKLIADLNADAASHAYDVGVNIGTTPYKISPLISPPGTILIQGHQGTAMGKLAAGCRFQSYYPITPASDESTYLEAQDAIPGDPPGAITVVQTEDEIAAICMMIGSALTGTRSSTSTSGPGFSLMAEALGWAGINEVPVVITLYQRSGPSTGLPTRHGQDDLLFTIYAGHGEFPRIVYASGDIEESFYDTCLCFNYSDIYQVPVIHMMDKFISSSTTTCPEFDISRVNIDRGKMIDAPDPEYQRFRLGGDGISPRSYLGLEGGIFWNTGDESDETGHITEDPVMRRDMMDKRLSRMDIILERIPDDEQAILHAEGDYTIISWGSTKGPILDALRMLHDEGIRVGFIQVKLLHPFPAKLMKRLLGGAKTIINVEANYTAQLEKLFAQNMDKRVSYHILKYTGRAMTCVEIRDALRSIIYGEAPYRTVLMHGD